MAARKTRPVLYEVFRPPVKTAEPAKKPRISTATTEPERPAPTDESGSETPARSLTSLLPGASAIIHGRQVTISTSTLAILIAALVVLLAVAFSAGRQYEASRAGIAGDSELTTGEQDAAGTVDDRTASGAAGDLSGSDESAQRTQSDSTRSGRPAGSAEQAAEPPAAEKPPQVSLRKGYHYVVIQHFNKRRERQAALDAARYLRDNGVDCATLTGADIRLVAVEPFLIKQADGAAARQERRRANDLMRRIRELGKQYNERLTKQGKGGYTFAECYLHEMK